MDNGYILCVNYNENRSENRGRKILWQSSIRVYTTVQCWCYFFQKIEHKEIVEISSC